MSLEDIVELTEVANYNLNRSKTGESSLYKIIEKFNPIAAKMDTNRQEKYENILEMADDRILNGKHPHLKDAINNYNLYKMEAVNQYNSGKTM